MITRYNVHRYSKHFEKCPAEWATEAIEVVRNAEFVYDRDEKVYVCCHKDKIFRIKNFKCDCNKDNCEHVTGLYMMFKVWHAERKETEKFINEQILGKKDED